MPTPKLPQELIDEIIDAVATASSSDVPDYTTLRACALTSRSWVTQARRHLFSTITLTEPPTVMAFTEWLLSAPPSIRGILPLLPIGTLVRHLRLGTAASARQEHASHSAPRGDFTFFTIDDIPTALLPNLDTLSIAALPDLCVVPQGLSALREQFRAVTELRLGRAFFSPRTFAQILDGFPRLASLHLTYERAARDRIGIRLLDGDHPRFRLPTSLRKLVLGVPDLPIIEWLVHRHGIARNQLRSLSILFQPLDDLQALQAMLGHCGGALTELSVGYADPPYVLAFGTVPTDRGRFVRSLINVLHASPLKTNSALKTLRIEGCDALERSHPQQDLFAWIPALLQQLRSGSVEEITLAFRYVCAADVHGLPWIDWPAINALFEGPSPLKAVRRLVVAVENSEVPRTKLHQVMARLLPAVAQSGAMRVRCVNEVIVDDHVRRASTGLTYLTLLDCVEEADSPAAKFETNELTEEYRYYQKALTEVDSDVEMYDCPL